MDINGSMMLINAELEGEKTFRLIPINAKCPYLEAVYLPKEQIMVVLSPYKRNILMEIDEESKKFRRNNKEKHIAEAWHEYPIITPVEIKSFINAFANNSDSFPLEKFGILSRVA